MVLIALTPSRSDFRRFNNARPDYDQLTNSPKRELKIFTPREGSVEHVGADNMAYGRAYIADWFADTLAENSA